MAVDEDGPIPDPMPPGQATPNRGLRRDPPVIDATAHPSASAEVPTGTETSDGTGDQPGGMDVMADNPELREAFTPTEEPTAESEPVAESNDEPPSPRRALMPLLLFGLGLVLAALLAAVLFRQFNPPVDEATMAEATRVDALQQRLTALESKPVPVPSTALLADRIGKLEGSATAFKTQLDDLQAKLVAQATAMAAAASPAPEPVVDLGPLQGRIADLEGGLKALRDQVAALPKPDDTAAKQIAGLGQGLAAVQAAVAAVPHIDLAPLNQKVAELGTTMSGLQATVAGLPRVDLDPLNAKIDALQHRVDPIEAAVAVPKDTTRTTEARRSGSAAEAHAAPMAVAAQAVVQALADGRPFGGALAALQGLGADPAALDRLRPVADKGAPTTAAILAGFEADRTAMLGAGQPASAGSVLDRVMAGARGLVEVRDTGTNPGQDPDAVVSRIAAALQTGDLKEALAEWGGLPADGKAASQPWADQVKVRVDAEEAARDIAAAAVAALVPPN